MRVVGDPEIVELLQKLADMAVMLDHAVGVDSETGLAFGLLLQVRPDVHAARIRPNEERLLVAIGPVDEVEGRGEEFFVHRLHALLREWPGIFALLLAPLAEARIFTRRFGRSGNALQHAARPVFGLEGRILRIVDILRLLLCIEVVEVAEELVETVHRRKEFVAVAEMVLAELPRHVAHRLQEVGDGWVLLRQPFRSAGQADLQQAGANGRLAGDEGRAPCRAGLLAIIVGEDRAFAGDAVDIGRPVAHHPAVVGADVPEANVIAHDDENVGSGRRLRVGRQDAARYADE
jgi:hypothetical protein